MRLPKSRAALRRPGVARMSLYQEPALYSALRAPDPQMFRWVGELVATHLHGERASVLDPACGPGDWLRLFAEEGWRIAGNDDSLPMVSAAQLALGRFGAEITYGDMRRLSLSSAPFDLATEVSGVVAELPGESAFVEHLVSVGAQLRSGGVYLLVLPRRSGSPAADGGGYREGPVPVTGGAEASIAYRLSGYDPRAEVAWVERHVAVRNSGLGAREWTDRYALHAGWTARLRDLVGAVPGLELTTVIDLPATEPDGLGDSMVVLRNH